MANGTTRPISEVEVGDMVLATDPKTGETGAREVIATLPHTDQLLALETSAGDIVTTEDHRYWNATDEAWQEGQHLDSGDRLLTADGDEVLVEGLDWSTDDTADAYDLDIADLHTFYIAAGDESVLVHNSDCKPLTTQKAGRTQPMTTAQATDLANYLGFKRTNYLVRGERVFSDGKRFIVQDTTSHNGVCGSSPVRLTISETRQPGWRPRTPC